MNPMPSWDAASIDRLQIRQSLARYTAARLGGPADYLHIAKNPDYSDTLELARQAWQRGLEVTVIGGGANILVSDAGIRGLTIINRAAQIKREDGGGMALITVSSGTSLIHLSRFCQEHGLAGLEWAIAVPGTVGGAVVNNAGAHGGDIAAILTRTLISEAQNGERWQAVDELDYAYRHSGLKARADHRFFIMKAQFKLRRGDPGVIKARMESNNDYRRRTQPPGASLGSIFKNPPGDFAGRLIEVAGLKGLRVGSVQVSAVHANFFVNTGAGATARDYYELIRLVRERVGKATGVELELEIQTLGDWD